VRVTGGFEKEAEGRTKGPPEYGTAIYATKRREESEGPTEGGKIRVFPFSETLWFLVFRF
jgi:hypothetical protein